MSYRIHLNIFKKILLKEQIKNFKLKKIDNHWYLPELAEKVFEINDETLSNISAFPLFKNFNDEYEPFLITKKLLKDILIYYRSFLYKVFNSKLEKIEKAKEKLKFIDKNSITAAFELISDFERYCIYEKFSWENKNELYKKSDMFKYQYYELLNLHDNLNFKNYCIILTHG